MARSPAAGLSSRTRVRVAPRGVCPACRRPKYSDARTCRRRGCPGYVDVWLGDNRVRLLENLLAFGGEVTMTTITAPSLPWSAECDVRGEHKHSGPLGCRVEPVAAQRFNCEADRRQSRLHKAAAQRTYRRYGSYPKRLAYAPELQARGVVHWHVVLAWDTPLNRRLSRHYVQQLHALHGQYGVGWPDRKLEVRSPANAARYLSKYLTKAGGGGLRELVVSGQAPTRAVYVHRELTATTRCTMRNLRLRRLFWAKWRRHPGCRAAEEVWELLKDADLDLVIPIETELAARLASVP